MPSDIARNTVACHAANMRANLLDSGHEGVGKQHRPEHAIAKLRAALRIAASPLGSSSDAPVMRPDPRLVAIFLIFEFISTIIKPYKTREA